MPDTDTDTVSDGRPGAHGPDGWQAAPRPGDEVAGIGHVLSTTDDDGELVVVIGPVEEGATPLRFLVDPALEEDIVDLAEAERTGDAVRYLGTVGLDSDLLLDRLTWAAAPTPHPVDAGPPAPLEGPAADLCPRCHHPYGRLTLRHDAALGRVHVECPTAPSPLDVAAETSPEAARLVAHLAHLDSSARDPLDASPQPGPDPTPPPAPRPPVAPARRNAARIEEAKPWQPYNSDGTINLGSYAYTGTVYMVQMAARLVLERNRDTADATGLPVEPPSPSVVTFLARQLLEAADEVQAAVRRDGHADRMDKSHDAARSAIRHALDLYPVPFGAADADRAAWRAAIVEHATMVLEVALTIAEPRR